MPLFNAADVVSRYSGRAKDEGGFEWVLRVDLVDSYANVNKAPANAAKTSTN